MKAADRLRFYIHPFLEALGAEYHGPHGSSDGSEWSFVTTRHGMPLHITVYDNWVACRFQHNSKSTYEYPPNPGGYTGKWNFHSSCRGKYPSLEQARVLAEDFLSKLNSQLPGERPVLPEIEGFVKRQNLIEKGKLWQVYPAEDINKIEKEGGESECRGYIVKKYGMKAYKNGQVRLAKIISEVL